MRIPPARTLVSTLFIALLGVQSALATPPSHAPAHGWRKKHDPYYAGYTGTQWAKDYGVLSGRCNRDAIGAVLGGAVGGVLGSQIGKGDTRTVATVLGTVAGVMIGAAIGRDMDEADRACMGHALELAPDHQTVQWTNAGTGSVWSVTPQRGYSADGRACREFTLATGQGRRSHEMACQTATGTWVMRD